MTQAPPASESELIREDLVEAIAARLDLREPNKEALRSIAATVASHFGIEGKTETFEGVVDVATGVGKTYVLAAAIEYFSALGHDNFAVITPGRTILEKTAANFTPGHRKSLLGGMEVRPVVITSENFASADKAAAMEDPDETKLFIFTVQALLGSEKNEVKRKTRKFQEGLGKAFYAHLESLDDLIVFADEHHTYYGDAFSAAIRDLTPHALIGLTATPDKKTPEEQIIYRYPLAAAIADKLVKTPVIVGRQDDRADWETKLRDGIVLLEKKRAAIERYCAETGKEAVNPVMFVVAPNIEEAKEVTRIVSDPGFDGGKYADHVLEIHSKSADEALAELDEVEAPESNVRVIVSVAKLKEGWDVKNVYVIASLRPSVSDVLTEQTLGRGLRLPFGEYTGREFLDTLEVIAHERYDALLKKTGVLNEAFVDYRTRAVFRLNAEGQLVATTETTKAELPVAVGDEVDPDQPRPTVTTIDAREAQAEEPNKLKPRADFPPLVIPRLVMTEVASAFSLADVTDFEPFRRQAQTLAADPSGWLRRTHVSAEVVTSADGLKETRLVTGKAVDRIESPAEAIPREEGRKRLLEMLLNAEIVDAREEKERRAAGRIVDAFLKGLGDKAEAVLGGYLESAGASLIHIVTRESRRYAQRPQFKTVVELIEFGPMRYGQPTTSRDRTGAFRKGVGYEGWKKSLYEQVWFDSNTERLVATILDDAEEILFWVRLHTNDLPILWQVGGRHYNPDLVAVEKGGVHWLIEPKMEKEMQSEDVQGKLEAAKRWASHVTSDPQVGAEWRYLLIPESAVEAAKGSWPALKALGVT